MDPGSQVSEVMFCTVTIGYMEWRQSGTVTIGHRSSHLGTLTIWYIFALLLLICVCACVCVCVCMCVCVRARVCVWVWVLLIRSQIILN